MEGSLAVKHMFAKKLCNDVAPSDEGVSKISMYSCKFQKNNSGSAGKKDFFDTEK